MALEKNWSYVLHCSLNNHALCQADFMMQLQFNLECTKYFEIME